MFNRLTGATMATHLTLVKPGEVVIGVSETHSHPSVLRAAAQAGARFIDTAGLAAFRDAIATEKPALVVLTRLAVTYDLMPLDAIRDGDFARVPLVIGTARDEGALHVAAYDAVSPDELAWFVRTTSWSSANER